VIDLSIAGTLQTFSGRVRAIRLSWQALFIVATALVLLALAVGDGGRDALMLAVTQIVTFTLLAILVGIDRLRKCAITRPLLVLLAASVFTAFWTVRPDASIRAILLWGMYSAIALTVASTISSLDAARRFLDALVVIGSWLCFVAAFMFWGASNPQMRWSSTFYWPNPFAGLLLLVVPLMLIRFLNAPRVRGALAHGLTAILLTVAFILTYSRGAWVVLGAIAPLGVILLRPARWRTVIARCAGFAALAGFLVFTLTRTVVPGTPDGGLAARAASIADSGDYSVQGRLNFWRAGLEIFRDHPLVGTGPGTFGAVHAAYQRDVRYYARDAHNVYVQIMAEMGAVGLGAILVLVSVIGTIWSRSLRAAWGREEYPLIVGLGLGVLAFFLHSALDMDWMYPAIPAMAFSLVGVLGWYDAVPRVQDAGPSLGARTWARVCGQRAGLLARGAVLLALLGALAAAWASWAAQRHFVWAQEGAQRGEWSIAVHHYALASRWAPFSSRYLDAYAWALVQTVESPPNLAVTLLRRAMRVDRMNEALPFHLALVLTSSQPTPPAQREAEELLRHALELDRFNRPDIYRTLARLYRDEGRYIDAERVYREATILYLGKNLGHGSALYLVLWPEVTKLFQDAAAFSADQGKLEQAARTLEQLLAEDPTVVDAALRLSVLYVRMNRSAEARALLKETSRRVPSDPRLMEALRTLR